MCGIFGLTERNDDLAREALRTFSYRGPDATAVVSDERVTLGHNRLSIIDLDARANQPMSDAKDTLRIVFNGEIYNYKRLQRELEGKGHVFSTASDTEVLLCAYREWGEEMMQRLRGMYAFAIYDRTARKLVLVTDQAGMKPIFYAQVDGVFTFASELKGIVHILKTKGKSLAVDSGSLGLYWMLGYVPVPKTIYSGIHRLPRRTIVTVDLDRGTIVERQYERPAAAASEDLRSLIENRVEEHLVADVPVGLFFSGGTDSSLIAAILRKLGVRLEAFSVELAARPEDREYFGRIAEHMDLSIHKFFFGPKEFDDVYPAVTQRIDEPFYDSSIFPTYFVSREAAKHVKVVLSGDGGDEYFLGYPRSIILSRMANSTLDAGMTLLDHMYVLTPRFRGKVDLFALLFRIFRRPLSYYLLTMSPAKDFVSAREWSAAKRALAARASRPTALDADLYLENDLLRKLDLATMYNSLEARIPLLDGDITAIAEAATAKRLPLSEKKPVLKEILATYLPRELVYRVKRGFGLDASAFFSSSRHLAGDLQKAIAYLHERKMLPPRPLPKPAVIVARRPQLVWQTLMLYHALKNAGI